MIGLVLATLILGHGSVAPMQAAGTATIDSALPNDGDSGRVERLMQGKLTPADTIDSVSLFGGYALVGWSRAGKPAGQALLADTAGWTLLNMGGGKYDVPTLVAFGLTNRQAHALVDAAEPLMPDLGYQPLLGTWQCASAIGSSLREVFAMDQTGRWLSFSNTSNNATNGSTGSWQNFLFWDSATRHWTMTTMGSQGWAYAGHSDGWRNNSLVFEGVQNTLKTSLDSRDTIQIAPDGSLSNQWEQRSGHGWVAASSSHCVKV